jgi:hypothetical protein
MRRHAEAEALVGTANAFHATAGNDGSGGGANGMYISPLSYSRNSYSMEASSQ